MAGVITDSAIEEIKSRRDLGDVISSYGIQVRHSGSSLKACCPFHREKTPSFSINSAQGYYHCFGCGESGDAIKFVQKQEGLPFADAVKKLASMCGVEITEEEDPQAGRRKRLYAVLADVADFYRRCLVQMKSAQIARNYLKSRGLDEKTQEDFLIGFAPEGAGPMLKWAEKNGYNLQDLADAGIIKAPERAGDLGYHRFSGRLMFTVRDRQGRVVAFSGRQLIERKNSGKYVNSPDTMVFKKSNVLFCFDKAASNIVKSPHREVIVCEGQIDCIRLHTNGFPVAVASLGTAFTQEHVKMLSRVADSAALAFDDDAAGHKAAIRSAALLLEAGMPVRVVRLPDGDDPDSFIRKKGGDAFARLMDAAESVVSFQYRVESAKEKSPASLDAVSRISKAMLSTIAHCPNAVIKASMVDESAKLLSLPSAALSEELAKVKVAPAQSKHAQPDAGYSFLGNDAEDAIDDLAVDEVPSEIASAAIPPSKLEMSFMGFLSDIECDGPVYDAVFKYLPQEVFAHGFTRDFTAAWLQGEETFAGFSASLGDDRRKWYDAVLLGGLKEQACQLDTFEILQTYVRNLWSERLKAVRGEMDAGADDVATVATRIKLINASKTIMRVRWAKVKDMIEDFKKGVY